MKKLGNSIWVVPFLSGFSAVGEPYRIEKATTEEEARKLIEEGFEDVYTTPKKLDTFQKEKIKGPINVSRDLQTRISGTYIAFQTFGIFHTVLSGFLRNLDIGILLLLLQEELVYCNLSTLLMLIFFQT